MVAWDADDGAPLIHAYAEGLGADVLAGKLIHDDASLRIVGIETEDRRLTIDGPEIPESEDRGQ